MASKKSKAPKKPSVAIIIAVGGRRGGKRGCPTTDEESAPAGTAKRARKRRK